MESSECSFEEPPGSKIPIIVGHQIFKLPPNINTTAEKRSIKPVSKELWNNWHWQLKERITTLEQLEEINLISDPMIWLTLAVKIPIHHFQVLYTDILTGHSL